MVSVDKAWALKIYAALWIFVTEEKQAIAAEDAACAYKHEDC